MPTAKSHEAEKIIGLDLGADDYVTKPFNPRELRARIRAVLRRTEGDLGEHVRFGNVDVDTARGEVRVDGKLVEMTPREFRLLLAFARNPGHVLTRDRLIDLAWGRDTYYSSNLYPIPLTLIMCRGSAASAASSSLQLRDDGMGQFCQADVGHLM
jgi:DNA-binding response OmpR family regulator